MSSRLQDRLRFGAAAALALALALIRPAVADVVAEAPCGVPTGLLEHNPPLLRVGKALDAGRLRIVVWGTRSAAGAGTSAPEQAFPNRLRELLAERYPEVALQVETVVQPGETAAQMLGKLKHGVLDREPDLVIWETGSADAARNVSLQDFGRAVSRGLKILHRHDADVMLMDMQYGPYSDLLANFRAHRGYLWWVSRQEEVGLLPRYQIMEHWSEQGRFDLATEDRDQQLANADAIHACLGELLEWMIADAAERARAEAAAAR